MRKYATNGTHYANTHARDLAGVESPDYCPCLELDGALCGRCDPGAADDYRYVADQQQAQRAAVLEALGQVDDDLPWLTAEQLAVWVGLSAARVENLLRAPIRHHEVTARAVGAAVLYALADRVPAVPFPDLTPTVPTVLEAAR